MRGQSALLILYQQRFQQVQIVQQLLQRLVADLPRRAQVIQLGTLGAQRIPLESDLHWQLGDDLA